MSRNKSVKQSQKQIDLAERRGMVLELRKQGGSFREIAAQLREQYSATGEHGVTPEYSHDLAFRDFRAALKELNDANSQSLEEHRALDLERLDALLAAQWEKAAQGDLLSFDKVVDVL